MKTSQKGNKSTLLKELKDSFEFPEFAGEENFFPESVWDREAVDEKKEPKRIRRSEVVFNYRERREEAKLNSELSQLMREVNNEIELLKKEDQSLVSDVSKITLAEIPEKAGVYHLRFLEFVIKLLKSIRHKISEGKLWLQVSFEKKKQKRFWMLAKHKGTKFSMSKELSQANNPG